MLAGAISVDLLVRFGRAAIPCRSHLAAGIDPVESHLPDGMIPS